MAQEEKRLRLTLLVLVFVAFIVLVVGVATDYWGQSTRTTAIHYGLWKGCGAIGVSDKSPIRCFSPEDVRVADWKRASRAFMVISCLFFGIAVLYSSMMQMRPKFPSLMLAFILSIARFKNLLGFVAIGPVSDLLDAYNIVDYGGISVVSSLTGVAVYTARSGIMKVPGLEFGFSYMLAWGGIAANIMGILLACCDQAGYHFI